MHTSLFYALVLLVSSVFFALCAFLVSITTAITSYTGQLLQLVQ
jgi:hypothetical protein